jgi:hypothetical protein
LQRGLAQRRQIVGHQARLGPDLDLGAVGTGERPRVLLAGPCHAQRRQSGEVGDRAGLAVARDEPRAADQRAARPPERPDGEVRVLERRKAHAQREVEALLDDIDATARRLDVEADARVVREVLRHDRRDLAQQQPDRAAHAHHAVGGGTRALDRRARRIDLGEHGCAVVVERLAGRRQREAARRPVQQLHTELPFEPGHAPAELRRRHAERARSGREAAVLDDLREEVQVVQVVGHRARFVSFAGNGKDRCRATSGGPRCGALT